MTAISTHPDNHTTAPLKGFILKTYRHYKGRKLGPYYFRKWKVGRRTFKQYIKPSDVEAVTAACQAHRKLHNRKKEGAKRENRFLDNWIFMGRMLERWDRGKEVSQEQQDYLVRLHREGMYIDGRPAIRPRRRYPNLEWMLKHCTTKQVVDWLLQQRAPGTSKSACGNWQSVPFGYPQISNWNESPASCLPAWTSKGSFTPPKRITDY